MGKRHWRISQQTDLSLEPGLPLKILKNFQVEEDYILEPGDMLYVPPGIAHNGIAIGDDCMTYSIGFRAPSRAELIGNWADDLLADNPRLALSLARRNPYLDPLNHIQIAALRRYRALSPDDPARGDWLTPRIAGEPYLDTPPLYYWVAALFARALSPWLLPLHDAARLATPLFMSLTLLFVGMTARELIGRRHGRSAGRAGRWSLGSR